MRGASHVRPKNISGTKALKRCRNKGESENVVLIDVDGYNFNNVIVIDIPENLTKKLRGSNGLKNDENHPPRTYIYIDDDESPEKNHAGAGVDGGSKFDSGASSSRRYGSDAQFAQENISPLKLSKGKRTYSGRGFNSRNSFSTRSDSGSSGDDVHDCEFMEDSSGKLREQWERASLKRKADANNDQCGRSDRASGDAHNDIRLNKNKQKYYEVPNKSKSKETSYEKGRSPAAAVGSKWGSMSCDPKEPSLDNANAGATGNEHPMHKKADIHGHSPVKDPSSCNSEQQTCDHSEHTGCDLCNSESRRHRQSSLFSNNQHAYNQHVDRNKSLQVECSSSDCGANGYVDIDCSQIGAGHREVKHKHIPTSSLEKNEENAHSIAPIIDADPIESSIINQREKLKETDEYKRALEEEWLARERALKIQAEEAQQLRRLKKRRKAETLRLLDMERRQKQRLEEIRETQKKDEENMNLKELYRTEVRQELSRLEITCHDMASLLRGLGIQVGDGPCPLSNEVHAAYKRALLSFHPDRASGSDLRQQVEAEEKFKLISRMKDKLLL